MFLQNMKTHIKYDNRSYLTQFKNTVAKIIPTALISVKEDNVKEVVTVKNMKDMP